MCIPHMPPKTQFFVHYTLRLEAIQVWLYIEKKCTEWSPKDIDMFKFWRNYVHTSYGHKAQIFVRFDLRWASYESILRKVHRMTQTDLDMFQANSVYLYTTYPLEPQLFVHFAMRWTVFFSSYHSTIRKVHQLTSKWSQHVQGQNYLSPYLICPRGPNFPPFHCKIPVTAQLLEKCTKGPPKWPWHVRGKKCPYV